MKRRDFMKLSAAMGAAVVLSNARSAYAAPANDRVNLGVIGCGSRSDWVCRDFLVRPQDDVRFTWCCDVDSRRAANRANQVKRDGVDPKLTQDARQVFDDPSVDAVVLVTPDHWHALHTIQACQAGKDVYCEKPTSRSAFEGDMMVAAAKKYDRIVAIGSQTRSAPYVLSAKKFLAEGYLGKVQFVRVNNMWPENRPSSTQPKLQPPQELDWDRWIGPSPYREYAPVFQQGLAWGYWWDFGNGILSTQGHHQLDLARWVLDLDIPKTCYSTGGYDLKEDPTMTPRQQSVTFDWGEYLMQVDQIMGVPYMLETDMVARQSDIFPYWPQNSTRVEIYGQNALMIIGRLGAGWQVFVRTKDRKPVVKQEEFGRYTNPEHMSNFVDSIREHKQPNAPVLEGHRSTMLVHYAHMSLRAGSVKLEIDPVTGKVTNSPEAMNFWRPEFRKEYDIPEIG